MFEGWVVEVTVVKRGVNFGGEDSDGVSGICCCCCWIEAETEADPAAMAACRLRLDRLPRLATDGFGEGEWREGCPA